MKKDKQVCNFGIKKFNEHKRDKEFVKQIREKEKKAKLNKYHCPEGYEWNLDLGKCVAVIGESTAPVGDKQKPSVPQNLRVTGVTDTSISLAWDASTDNVEVLAYKIFYKQENGQTYAVTTRGLVANFQGFIPNTAYSFYVKAVDTSNNLSNASAKVVTKTLLVSPPPPPPPSAAVIYIDFDGGVVSGTMWNTTGDIPYAASGLTITEEDAIVAGVAEDYSPYNVVVTTDKNLYNSASAIKRSWIIVTESYSWYCGSTPCAGGVAYIGSIDWGSKTPGWVFSSALGYSTKYIAEATSHETGHTIGLRHQSLYDANCIKLQEYNPGNSICGCAPIMGVSYYQPDGKWWVGSTSLGCTNIQDDNAILISKLGSKI